MAQQLPLIQPESSWTPPHEYPRLFDEKELSVDIETYDPNLKTLGPGWSRGDGYIVGVGIATREKSWYFPMRHEGGGNLDARMTMSWLRNLLKLDTTKCLFNGMYDVGWLESEDVKVGGKIIDPMGAAALVNENRRSYAFNRLLKIYTKHTKNEDLLREAADAWGIDPKSGMWKLHSKYVGIYGEADAACNWDLFDALKPELEAQGMWDLFEMEMDLYRVWIDMTRRGIRIDESWVAQSRETILKEITEIQNRLGGIDVNNAQEIGALFEKEGIRVPRQPKNKTKFSIKNEWLKKIGSDLSRDIERNRRLAKLLSTSIDGMILGHLHNGRIHPDWHPLKNDSDTGVVSGRVSATNPSPQVFPKRDQEFGILTRGAFLPEEGEDWVSSDQCQQEPRWTVHYANALGLPGVERMVQAYEDDPNMSYHEKCAEFAGIGVKESKPINLGVVYGMGRKKMLVELQKLGVPKERAELVFDKYHRELPYVRELTQHISDRASRRGWVRTVLGRRFHFDQWEPSDNFGKGDDWVKPVSKQVAIKQRDAGDPQWRGREIVRAFTRKSPNRVIQGTSADQIKKAMLDIWKCGGPTMLMQIHDDVCFSNGQGAAGIKIIRDCMENAIKSTIPFVVAIDIGDRWMGKEEED